MYQPTFDYLCTIVECGQLSKAAKKLNVSQQNLSSYIKRLEENYGLPIFNKEKKNYTLTKFGEYLYQRAQIINRLYSSIFNYIDEYNNKRSITIACPVSYSSLIYDILPITDFQGSFPDVNIKVVTGTPSDYADLFIYGSIDVLLAGSGVIQQLSKEIIVINHVICKEQKHIVTSLQAIKRAYGDKADMLYQKWLSDGAYYNEISNIPLLQLASNTNLENNMVAIARKYGEELNSYLTTSSLALIKQFLDSGVGYYVASYYEALELVTGSELLMAPFLDVNTMIMNIAVKESSLDKEYIRDFWRAIEIFILGEDLSVKSQ